MAVRGRRPVTILVVEDEAIVARDIQRTLDDLGYDVLTPAATCEDAILRASERCPDLVLMDIRISGERDGIETAEILRRRFRVPVVFLTAYADDVTIERAKRAQPYGYLLKPIKPNELRSAVEVVIYKRQIELADRLAAVGTMAAGVASEINDPLTTVLTNVQFGFRELQNHRGELRGLLSEEAYGPLFRRFEDILKKLAEAERGGHRISKMLAELRTFAHPQMHDEHPVDLRRVLSWAGEVVAHEIRSRAALAMELDQLPLVNGDESRLGQVFVNLLLNAAQAITPGHVRDNEVRVVACTAPDGRAMVEVRDTGCGISPDHMGRVFDPFFSTKPVGTGTGLGLAICHGVIKSLGGDITVESQPGRGSVFRVVLPAARPEAITPPGGFPVIRAGRVLVIEPDPENESWVREALRPDHHHVSFARAVREANAMIERGEIVDAIICPLELAEMSGMDFYDELLRTRPDLARRVLFLAGGSSTAKARAFADSVSNPCLYRPLSPETLRRTIRGLLQTVFSIS